MRNKELWKPSRWIFNSKKRRFEINPQVVFGGSHYIAQLQLDAYIPVFQRYISGNLLDAGCGNVPYYGVYAGRIREVTCIDWSTNEQSLQHLDFTVDLNGPLPLEASQFDTVLLTDVLAHIRFPEQLIKELSRVLKPNGHLVLTTPFVYWISEAPHEFFHPSQYALESMCQEAGLQIVLLESYGGRMDVLMDTLNKSMASGWRYRAFRLLASLVKKSSWLRKNREKTKYSYPLGFVLVAKKK
jgi:2-polyprenyl-3-methyl-5-hydroxy-6-metoxy-1,4-benzoquinol methylase